MMNLFSMFDPSNSIMKINMWSSIMMIMIFSSIKVKLNKKISNLMKMEYFSKSKLKTKMIEKMAVNLFLMFLSMNIINMMPFTFISSSMPNINLSVLMTIWIMLMIMTIFNFGKNFLIKLTPPSTPLALMPLMVIIEAVSIIIRPFTLTLRITANMISGHITFLMVSSALIDNFSTSIMYSMPFYLMLVMESFMALIQSYIIVTLMSMFLSEVN